MAVVAMPAHVTNIAPHIDGLVFSYANNATLPAESLTQVALIPLSQRIADIHSTP